MTKAAELLECSSFDPGSVIHLRTKSRDYQLECLGEDVIRISGHPHFCPAPVLARLQGSIDREGKFKPGFIGCGMRLVFRRFDQRDPITTSEIAGISIESASHSHLAA